jgi:hypothetical protein
MLAAAAALLIGGEALHGSARAEADAGRATPKWCEPAGKQTVAVALARHAVGLAGIKLRLDYPRERVGIPGMNDDAAVKERVRGMPPSVLSVPNDEDGDLVVSMVSASTIDPGRLFTVEFDRCAATSAPAIGDFHCEVEQASDEHAKLVDGAVCSVTLVNDKGGHDE